ncbi:MAG: hypothetical protein U0531_15655 [Dehalococcoidia bacterium]
MARGVLTFLLALGTFLAAGTGAIVLLAPTPADSPRAAASGPTTTATPSPAAVSATATVTPAADTEFALVEGVPSIPQPGQPSRLVIPSIALDTRITEVGITLERGKPVWETAAFAVGYHRGTAAGLGNAVRRAHQQPRRRKGMSSGGCSEVRIGDRVEVYAGDRRRTYDVTELRVGANGGPGA